MVLTRKQTREMNELREQLSTLTSTTNPLDFLHSDLPDLDDLDDLDDRDDAPSVATPGHGHVLQAHNKTKNMQGSARKGLQSWPLGEKKVGGTGFGGGLDLAVQAVGGGSRVGGSGVEVVPSASEPTQDADHGQSALASNTPTRTSPTDPSQQQNVVMYPSRDSFAPIPAGSVPAVTASIVENITSTNWMTQVGAMNELRRLAVRDAPACDGLLSSNGAVVFPAIVKGIKSPRSNVSKSAIMTVRDLVELVPGRTGEELGKDAGLADVNGLLSVLLTKAASNDKKFVVDEAVGALDVMCRSVDGLEAEHPGAVLSPVLVGTTEHKNPKVRGRCFVMLQTLMETGGEFSDGEFSPGVTCSRLLKGDEGVLRRVIVACDRGITDNTPEAREGARAVLGAVMKEIKEMRENSRTTEMVQMALLVDENGDVDEENEGNEDEADGGAPESLLVRYLTMALGNNRGKAVLLLEKCRLNVD